MNTLAATAPENKSNAIANSVTQMQSSTESALQQVVDLPQYTMQETSDSDPQIKQPVQLQEKPKADISVQKKHIKFADNRPEAIAQRKYRLLANAQVMQPKGKARWTAEQHAERNERMRVDHELFEKQRNSTNEVHQNDRDYFNAYMQIAKQSIRVYRGDGRGINANSLQNLNFTDIIAEQTPDITFDGVLEHTHTSTMKNGMVSTTSDFNIAYGFAKDSHEWGIVYTILVDNYIDTVALLKERYFKHRFEGQKEMLIPGNIPASKIISATLYGSDGKVHGEKRNGQ